MENVSSNSVMAPTPEEHHDLSGTSALSAEPDDPEDGAFGQDSSGKRNQGATEDAGEGVSEVVPSRIGEVEKGIEIFMTRNEERTVSLLPSLPPKPQ